VIRGIRPILEGLLGEWPSITTGNYATVADLSSSRPEDILGSVEVSGEGKIVGEFQPSGTYRIITNEGM
jgi:hypothetical protein